MAEGNAVLQLTSDVLGNQLSVGSSALDLDDVYDNRLAILLGQLVLQSNALFAALTDHHTGLSAVDVDGNAGSGSGRIHSALDLDLGDASVLQLSLQLSADLVILDEVIAEILLGGKPADVYKRQRSSCKPHTIKFDALVSRGVMLAVTCAANQIGRAHV